MDTLQLTSLVSVLLVLSIASERLVEIVKGLIPPLTIEQADSAREGWRRATLQVLAIAAGVLTAFLAQSALPADLLPAASGSPWSIVALGLLASGGSGFWNSVLSYLSKVNDLKSVEVQTKQTELIVQQDALAPELRESLKAVSGAVIRV